MIIPQKKTFENTSYLLLSAKILNKPLYDILFNNYKPSSHRKISKISTDQFWTISKYCWSHKSHYNCKWWKPVWAFLSFESDLTNKGEQTRFPRLVSGINIKLPSTILSKISLGYSESLIVKAGDWFFSVANPKEIATSIPGPL